MKNITLLTLTLATVLLTGCTENVRSRMWGGTSTQDLAPNRKLVNVTWKDADMWILTRPMTSNDVAESYEFSERSSFGLLQGTVRIVETKTKQ